MTPYEHHAARASQVIDRLSDDKQKPYVWALMALVEAQLATAAAIHESNVRAAQQRELSDRMARQWVAR